jgi:hypothetical protein
MREDWLVVSPHCWAGPHGKLHPPTGIPYDCREARPLPCTGSSLQRPPVARYAGGGRKFWSPNEPPSTEAAGAPSQRSSTVA